MTAVVWFIKCFSFNIVVLGMWWFTCGSRLIGVHITVDTPPPGLIITGFLRLTPPVHYRQQRKRREALISPCCCRAVIWLSDAPGTHSADANVIWCKEQAKPHPVLWESGDVMWSSIQPLSPYSRAINYSYYPMHLYCAQWEHVWPMYSF